MSARPVSIVIPTHDRRDAVVRAVRALGNQRYPPEAIDVVVVADGCSDGTAAALESGEWPFRLQVVSQASSGPAAARNRGAAAAQSSLIIFLDDDIEVSPGFVAAHVARHEAPDTVAIGYLPVDLQGRRDFFAVMLRAWWEAMFERMREPGHRYVYSDLLSGNFSLPRALFDRVGRFDESLRCHEDYELGYRLIESGAQFQFASEAVGTHHEHTTLPRALARKRDEGRADVALASRYPELLALLPLAPQRHPATRRGRLLRHLAASRPAVGDRLASRYSSMLDALERLRLRTRWRRLLDDLLSYWYWRGVTEAGGGNLVSRARSPIADPPRTTCDIDLRAGVDAAGRELDAARADAIRLVWGPHAVVEIARQPGAERVQGRHLRMVLRNASKAMAEAFARSEMDAPAPLRQPPHSDPRPVDGPGEPWREM